MIIGIRPKFIININSNENIFFKLQYRNLETFIHPLSPKDSHYIKRFNSTKLNKEQLLEIAKHIKNLDDPKFKLMITPFDEDSVDWLSLDVGLTTSVGISSHIYIRGFNNEDTAPASLTQGFRIGARVDDKLYLVKSGVTYSSKIFMTDEVVGVGTTAMGTTSSVKEYVVTSGPTANVLTIGSHNLVSGETVKINSDDGDLPENIIAHATYYVIDNGDPLKSIKAPSGKPSKCPSMRSVPSLSTTRKESPIAGIYSPSSISPPDNPTSPDTLSWSYSRLAIWLNGCPFVREKTQKRQHAIFYELS